MRNQNTHRNWNNRNKLRHKLKLRFITLHKELFDKIPANSFNEHRSDTGKEIVELARKKIGFSPKYVNCDLFRSLMHTYKELNNAKSI